MSDDRTTDEQVRAMLARRARDVSPAPDARARVEERLDAPTARPAPPGIGRTAVAVAAAVALVGAGLLAAALRPDSGRTVTVGPAATTAPAAPPGQPSGAGVAIWPFTDLAGQALLQADADAGRRDDLLDPRAAAGQYLSDRLGRVGFAVDEAEVLDERHARVPFHLLDRTSQGWVDVQRDPGAGSVWYVTASASEGLAVHMFGYDGRAVTGEVVPAVTGTLTLVYEGLDGSALGEEERAVRARRPVGVERSVGSRAGVVVRMSLTVDGDVAGLTEIRLDSA